MRGGSAAHVPRAVRSAGSTGGSSVHRDAAAIYARRDDDRGQVRRREAAVAAMPRGTALVYPATHKIARAIKRRRLAVRSVAR
jgi:hypothetical protein